ncbi:hypothetical protein [Pengzhenrongella sicca]|uniref:Uncharacterized protein n=1 Tax=Pengzhenrongella sicca TaxID=2819238 RepID=A0A8A4ZHN5_9MICO|nr:hypothetical protein [Pengzhenrongella sicca]QTE30027.1 hypothetical protein J4E96_03105 [Pengzhenrongella sicca]
MSDATDELRLRRLEVFDAHICSGDETDLISIEPDDLGLPKSTRSVVIVGLTCSGVLDKLGGAPSPGDEGLVEYEVGFSVEFEAVMAEEDASANNWPCEIRKDGLVIVRTSLDMTGKTGVVYERDEILGFIDYIGLRRADGTPASAVGLLNEDAKVLEFPPA